MPEISVIVPVYNCEPYLERCIRSIMAQTYSNLEIICVNDGSTDDSGNDFVFADIRFEVNLDEKKR